MKLVPLGAVTRTVAPRPFSMTAMAARNLCRLDLDRPLIHRLNERHVRRIGRQKPMEVDGTNPRCLDQVLERLVVHRSQVGRQPDGRLRALPAGREAARNLIDLWMHRMNIRQYDPGAAPAGRCACLEVT